MTLCHSSRRLIRKRTLFFFYTWGSRDQNPKKPFRKALWEKPCVVAPCNYCMEPGRVHLRVAGTQEAEAGASWIEEEPEPSVSEHQWGTQRKPWLKFLNPEEPHSWALTAASIPTPPENWNSLFSPWPTKPVSLLLWQYNCAHRDTSRKTGSLPLKSQLQSGKFPNDNFSSKIVSQPALLCLPKADIPACSYRWELDKDSLKSVLSGMACRLWPNPQKDTG